jgi:hypothetical protein
MPDSSDTSFMPAPKNFRLNDDLRRQFEQICKENLLDERSVAEAWLLQFIEADAEQRKAVARRYSEWLDRIKPAGAEKNSRSATPKTKSKP